MKREEVKEKIKKYIEEHGEPIGGYYYDDCHLVLEYSDSETGLNILSDETFKYWEDNALIGKYVLKEEYEKLLKEIGVDCIVLPYEYGYDEDSLDFIENQLDEFCFGIPELETKFEKMSNAEKVQWYNELNNDEDNDTLLDNEKIER